MDQTQTPLRMRCPNCSNQLFEVCASRVLLDRSTAEPIPLLDVCLRCKGIWFDHQELLACAMAEANQPRGTARTLEDTGSTTAAVSSKRCPKCPEASLAWRYPLGTFGPRAEQCLKCQGTWTDRAGLKAISASLTQKIQEQSPTIFFAEALAELTKPDQEVADLIALAGVANTSAQIQVFSSPTFILSINPIPLAVDMPREHRPIMIWLLIGLNAAVWVTQTIFVTDPEAFFSQWGHVPTRLWSVGLLTSSFIHMNVLHLVFNMWGFWLFGRFVEHSVGRVSALLLYLGSGLAGALLHAYAILHLPELDPGDAVFRWSVNAPAIGASGAVSGFLGAFLALNPVGRIRMAWGGRIIHMPAWLYLGGWFIVQLLFGLTLYSVGLSLVAYFGHVGGFVCGWFGAFALNYWKRQPKLAG